MVGASVPKLGNASEHHTPQNRGLWKGEKNIEDVLARSRFSNRLRRKSMYSAIIIRWR